MRTDMGIIYNLIFVIFAFFYIPIFLLRKGKREGVGVRFGIYPKELIERLNERKNIWIHAVSVGEVMAVSSLIAGLRSRYPGHRLVMTTVTETGNSVVKKLAKQDEIVLFLPLDITFVVKKVVTYIKPSVLIIAETELWPNLIREANSNNIPIVLVNGRISDRSFRGYACVRFMLTPILKKISLFCMQTKRDGERIISLGAEDIKVKVSGNMKFDSAVSIDLSDEEKRNLRSRLNIREDEKLFIAGSTHPGEEEIIVSVFKNLKGRFQNLRLLIAPRHIERTTDIEKLVTRYALTSIRISQLSTSTRYEIFILDTIGQLKNLYSIAEIVFIGGSLVKKGGQNIIEPAVFARPILFGPYTFNFRDIVELFLKEEAAIMVNDAPSLEETLSSLLKDSVLCSKFGQRAKEIVETNRGATDTTLKAINTIMEN